MALLVAMKSVYPSAGDFVTVSAAIAPSAPADEPGARALAAQAMVGDRDLEGRVHGLGARVGEEDLRKDGRRDRGDPLRELERARMPGGERCREIELPRLAPDRLDDARPAMPRVHAPERRQAVEHLAAVRGRVVHVFRRHDELRRRLEARVVGERHPVVLKRPRDLH
jgi:hypothetical protein